MHTLWFTFSVLLMIAGLIGSVVPGLPGLPVILAGQFLYAWATDFQIIGLSFLLWMLFLTIIGSVADIIASQAGARRQGASRLGLAGALIGGLVGTFTLGLIGIIFGPLAGALLGEIIHGRPLERAAAVGWWVFLGLWAGILLKIVVGFFMVGLFVLRVI